MIVISLSRRQFLRTAVKVGVLTSLPSGLLVKSPNPGWLLPPYEEQEQDLGLATKSQTITAASNPSSKKRLVNQKLQPIKKVLSFYNTHTGEFLKNCTFWADNKFCSQALKQISSLCRDHRSGSVHTLDPQLFALLHRLMQKVETTRIVNIISGYRSPSTNKALSKQSHGVARNSYHTKGKAIDFYVHGIPLKYLKRAALALKGGGVGGYRQFVHIDTGPVRRWGVIGC